MSEASIREGNARAGIQIGATIALLIGFKLWLAASFPITGDEAYFISWGFKPDFGYYDHPPMVGWMIAALAQLSTAAWVLRMPVVLLPAVIGVGLFFALRRADRQKALYAALAFMLLPINVWNVFITTDTPLIFFSFFSGLAWWKARERDSAAWYLAAGVLLGLAFLSKYFSVLLAAVFFFDVAVAPRSRRPWRGLVLSYAAALPFILYNAWWNFENCWANVMFNVYNRHDDAGLSIGSVAVYVVIVAYTLSPVALGQMARRQWRDSLSGLPGVRFLLLAAGLPFAAFALVSIAHSIGLHWVLAFVPFFFMLAALTLNAKQLKGSVVYLGLFSLLHVLAIAVAAALPIQTWKSSRLYDGIVFHFRIHDVVAEMLRYQSEFELAADGYSPATTAGYYAGRYVFVFGTASSHARHDDLVTDFRALKGKNILVFRKNRPEESEYQPYFRTVEVRSFALSGATFYLVLGRGFYYDAYRDRVLTAVRDRFYRIPSFLPQGGCVFCERYFGSFCPVRG